MAQRIVMVAPNGARRTHADHTAIPITPDELATCAFECAASGASAFHLHVRGDRQQHSIDVGRYREAIAAIKDRVPDLPIQCTTEAAGVFSTDEQFAMVRELRSAWVSFSLAEMMREGPQPADDFLQWAHEAGTRIQFILYSPEDIDAFAALHRAGDLHDDHPHLILVAGRYGLDDVSSCSHFDALYARLSATGLADDTHWMTCAFGREELACLKRAMAVGSHVRVGFENAVVDHCGAPLQDNAQRVRAVCEIAQVLGIEVSSYADVRKQLHIIPEHTAR
ncbi:3-keto-5-aminohexanoate cleavage protein [Pseudooceanicola nitratireducens]|uniref:3-keto-5-aminohexanoate cleavage protein n=1 Tax=Pseudooceanicola nitratireducens TaxID=517719 RepID=UPI0023F2C2F6|nr:3-keto-5-aminohexanoate cleavage protein [Pseudooceanicola nitratireducens]